MIEIAAGCISTAALVWFLECVVFRTPKSKPTMEQRRAAIAEKRRVLERDRREWNCGFDDPQHGIGRTLKVAEIDARLLALADEEGKLVE